MGKKLKKAGWAIGASVLHISLNKIQKRLIDAGYFLLQLVLIPRNHSINAKKQSQMKKFLFVLAIGAFAACNNSGGSESTHDSTVVKDSTKMMSTDSTKMMSTDSTSKMSADTTKKDTATKK